MSDIVSQFEERFADTGQQPEQPPAANKWKRKKCLHGKRKDLCRDCGGASLCLHNRQKHICHECGGASLCEHGKRKTVCKKDTTASVRTVSVIIFRMTRGLKGKPEWSTRQYIRKLLDMSRYDVVHKGDTVKMQYYIYEGYAGDLVKEQLSELATMIFGKGCHFNTRVDKTYEKGEEDAIKSKMTNICKEIFGECDSDNSMFSWQNHYTIYLDLVDINSYGPGDIHCQVRLETPLTNGLLQSQGCYAKHCFVASLKFKRKLFRDSETKRSYYNVEVLESHLWYEGLTQLDPDECSRHYIRFVENKQKLPG